MTGHWLVKTEPSSYSWDDLVRDGNAVWDGVRNHEARRNLEAMKQGDRVLVYHSVEGKVIVGTAHVVATAFADPRAQPGEPWVAVRLAADKAFRTPVSLAAIRARPEFAELLLVRRPRLSVMPVPEANYHALVAWGAGTAA